MPDISVIKGNDNTIYNIKDPVAQSSIVIARGDYPSLDNRLDAVDTSL